MNTAGRSRAFVGLELRPLHPLEASTLYTATVQGVQNASGIAMAGEHSWQFRTKNGAVVQNAMPVETSYQDRQRKEGGSDAWRARRKARGRDRSLPLF